MGKRQERALCEMSRHGQSDELCQHLGSVDRKPMGCPKNASMIGSRAQRIRRDAFAAAMGITSRIVGQQVGRPSSDAA